MTDTSKESERAMSDDPELYVSGWLIYKSGRGWYRQNAQGYTSDASEAGRYSHADAWLHSHPNGINGTCDGMTIMHESEITPPPKRYTETEAHALVAAALRAAASEVTGIMEPLALKAYDVGYNSACTDAEDTILALIPTGASAALDKLLAEARREGMEQAAEIATKEKNAGWNDGDAGDYGTGYYDCADIVLAAIRAEMGDDT